MQVQTAGLTDAERSGVEAMATDAVIREVLGQPLLVFDAGLQEVPTRESVEEGQWFVFGGELVGWWSVYRRGVGCQDYLVSSHEARGEAVEALYRGIAEASVSLAAVCRGCRYPITPNGCETPGCLDSIWMTRAVAERLGRVAREASERADGYRAAMRMARLGGR